MPTERLTRSFDAYCPSCEKTRPVSIHSIYAMNKTKPTHGGLCKPCFAIYNTKRKVSYDIKCPDCLDQRSVSYRAWRNIERGLILGCCKVCANKRTSASLKAKPKKGKTPLTPEKKASRARRKKQWAERNRERLNARFRALYHKNKERDKQARRAWTIKRRALGPPIKKSTIQSLEDRFPQCYLCWHDLNGKYEVDHIIPVSRGGDNELCNLALACPGCNRRKHAKRLSVFLAERTAHALY